MTKVENGVSFRKSVIVILGAFMVMHYDVYINLMND